MTTSGSRLSYHGGGGLVSVTENVPQVFLASGQDLRAAFEKAIEAQVSILNPRTVDYNDF